MLVTAFGPFGPYKVNPGAVVARAVFGNTVEVLSVSFEAVDAFIESFPQNENQLLMFGVSGRAKNVQIERNSSDRIEELADISGVSRPRQNADVKCGTLLEHIEGTNLWDISEDAGSYLCNYIYYQACTHLKHVNSGFIHVPDFGRVPLPLQVIRIRRLLSKIHHP